MCSVPAYFFSTSGFLVRWHHHLSRFSTYLISVRTFNNIITFLRRQTQGGNLSDDRESVYGFFHDKEMSIKTLPIVRYHCSLNNFSYFWKYTIRIQLRYKSVHLFIFCSSLFIFYSENWFYRRNKLENLEWNNE